MASGKHIAPKPVKEKKRQRAAEPAVPQEEVMQSAAADSAHDDTPIRQPEAVKAVQDAPIVPAAEEKKEAVSASSEVLPYDEYYDDEFDDELMDERRGGRVVVRVLIALAAVIVLCLALVGLSGLPGIVSEDVAIVENADGAALITQLSDPSLSEAAPSLADLEVENTPAGFPSALMPIYKKAPASPDVRNILLVCQDGAGSNCDIYVLLSFNSTTGNLLFTTLLSDLWVNIPQVGWNVLGAAYPNGGVGMMINTLNSNFDLDIQDYMIISMEKLIDKINSLGGIMLSLTPEEAAYINSQTPGSLSLSTGKQVLSGAQSMVHIRSRMLGGSITRADKQSEAIYSLIGSIVNDTPNLVDWVLFARKGITTNMTLAELIKLYFAVNSCPVITISQSALPASDSWQYASSGDATVVAADIAQNRDFLHSEILK